MSVRRLRYRVVARVAGVGSPGRPLFVALAVWGGALIAREAKALVPSAVIWARGGTSRSTFCAAVAAEAIRVPDPFFTTTERWIVRRVAPDCSRIELTDLPKIRDEVKLLRGGV